jgi:hypothetical protein
MSISNSIEGLRNGDCDITALSFMLPTNEFLCVPFGATGIVILTQKNFTLKQLSLQNLYDIYNGSISSWNQLGISKNDTIIPLYRSKSDNLNYVFSNFLAQIYNTPPSISPSISPSIFRNIPQSKNISITSQSDTITYIEQHSNAIGFDRPYIPDYLAQLALINKQGYPTYPYSKFSSVVNRYRSKEYSIPPTIDQLNLFNLPGDDSYPLVYYDFVCITKTNVSRLNVLVHSELVSLLKKFPGSKSVEFAYEACPGNVRTASIDALDCAFYNTNCERFNTLSETEKTIIIVGAIVCTVCLCTFIVIMFLQFVRYRNKVKKLNELNQSLLQADSLGHVKVKLSMDELILEDLVGRGSFGDVYRARLHGTVVAVKRFVMGKGKSSLELKELFTKETEILKQLRHPNILFFIGCEIKHPHMYIVTEFCELGDLQNILLDSSITLTLDKQLSFAVQAARGVLYLHRLSPSLIHRDIKTSNLLVDKNWTVKVADFGLTRAQQLNETMTICGTPAYCAPEVLSNNRYSEKADVFSFGIVLYEIFARKIPYSDKNAYEIVSLVVNNNLRPSITEPPFDDIKLVPEAITQLIERCWDASPIERPSFAEIVHILESVIKNPDIPPEPYIEEMTESPFYYEERRDDSQLIDVSESFINNLL